MTPRDALAMTHPQAVMIQTTSRCNAACVICPNPRVRRTMPQGDMDDGLFAALIDELAAFPPLKRVMLYLMNEPLLDAKIVERIRRARAALPDVELYLLTNGVALTEQLSDELLDAGLTWIGFSLHAMRAETYRRITGRRDFDKVLANVTRHVERALRQHGPDSVAVKAIHIRPHVTAEEWDELQQYWRGVGLKRLELENGYISRAGNVEVYGHEPVQRDAILGCRTVWAYEMAHVLFDGSVVPCCMDYRRQAVWGNVRDAGLLAVWQGATRREFLERMDGRALPPNDLCAHCEDAIPAPKPVEAPAPTPDIVLVHPPPWLTSGPPLGLAALKAWVEREGYRAEIVDTNIDIYHAVPPAHRKLWEWEEGQVWERGADVERLFGPALREAAAKLAAHPAPVVGFSLASRKEIAAAMLAAEVARLAPDKLLVAGGPGAATREERDRFFDLCGGLVKIFVVGEGEVTLAALLARHRHGQTAEGLPGVAYYREGQATFVEPGVPLEAAALPAPDYRSFDLSRYSAPALFVEWSRGCTGACAFCNVRRYWRRYRAKPADAVLRELATLIERHGVEWLSLADPIVNGRPEILEAICDGIIAQGWKLRWSAGLSPNHPLTAAQFAKMAAAGCYRLEFGVESGSDRVLAAMKKRYTAAAALQMCRDAHAAGIDVVLYLIVGFPGETDDDFAATLRLVEDLAPAVKLVRSVNSLLLIPGAELCERPERFGIVAPDRTQPGWERRWQAGDLDAAVRTARLERLLARLRELNVPVEFSNRDELIADQRRHDERFAALHRRLTTLDERFHSLGIRATSLLGASPETAPPGDLALAICPVWGVDMPPYGLASLAANVAAAGLAPLVFDFNIAVYRRSRPELQRFWEEDSFRHWTDLADWQRLRPHLDESIQWAADQLLATGRRVLGFSVYSPNRRFTVEVCRRIKAADRGRVIVVGGRGIYTQRERLLFPPDSVDYFLVGEGERAFVELARTLQRGEDPRAWPYVDYFDGAHLQRSPRPELVADPENLTPPDYAQFDRAAYRTNELPMLASRGCIGHCAFCNDHEYMGALRQRPGAQVAEEMLRHRRELGVRQFRFNDQLINGDLPALEALCDALIAAGADVEWIALAAPRGDMADELLRKLKAAGCKTLNLGIESGSDHVLRRMAKGFRVADIEKALAQIRAAGINTMINFIVGFPSETEADFEQTLDLVRRNRANICGVNSINTCIMLLDSPLEKHKEQFHIAVPVSGPADTGWVHGSNTPEVRQLRAKRLLDVLAELDIPVRVSNLHEKQADPSSLEPPMAEPPPAESPPDRRKGLPRYEPIEARPVDVLLIMPPVWGVDVPPLGIAYVQSYVQARGVSAQCLDLNIKFYNRAPDPSLWRMESYKHWTETELFEATLASVLDLFDHYVAQITAHPARIVGLSVNTGNYSFARALARRLKAARPDRPIVLGGPGITNSFDIATLTTDEADYLVLGEGEQAAHALFRGLLAGDVPPIPGVLPVAVPFDYDRLTRVIVEHLSEVEWPRLTDFNLAEYATDAVPILGSRGCIRRCTFCNDHHIYQKFRRRGPESVAAEMKWHADQQRLRFTFHDVLVNGSIPDLEGLCERLIADGREFQWGGQGVIRREMTPAIFAKMARAGCQSFVFGVESFSDRVLKLMNKPYTQAEAEAVLAACHAAGIQTNINVIVGFPGEGEKEFRETYDFVRDHADIIDQVASISPCLINLGSRLFERREEYGIRFPDHEGSVKWWTEDGNTFEERRRRVLALTTLLARREQDVHTVNLYDEKRGELPEVILDEPTAPLESCARDDDETRPDVVLVLPPPWGVDFPPLSLATLASSLRAQGQRVVLRDLNVEWYDAAGDHLRTYWDLECLKFWTADGRLPEIIAFFQPQIAAWLDELQRTNPRAVGFSTNESNLPLAVHLGQRIKKKLPETAIILGGPGVHWPADRERIGPVADFCVVGEGEFALPALLTALRNGGAPAPMPGVVRRENGAWHDGPAVEPLPDLDALPLPEFGDLPLHRYRTNQFPLQLGRGCVNRCHFCNDHRMIPGYRAFSPERVLAQIRQLKQRHGAFAFAFNDLLVNADLPRLRRFCEQVVAQNERLAWTGQCLVRSDMAKADYQLLRRAGCVSLVFGIESFSDDVLKLMGKRFNADAAAKALARAKAAGLEVLVNLIVGFPGETEASFEATCAFVKKHAKHIDRVSALSTCIVVAQCRIEKEPEAFGVVLPQPEHWCQWYTQDGENTYEVRVARLRRLAAVLAEAGIPHGMSNLYREALTDA
jgi:radical SAM superfamily enzyme YgiQ (UPF0313 family)